MRPQNLNNTEWLQAPGLQRLFEAMECDGEETRVNGGAVRNAIQGEEINDVDLATTMVPDRVVEVLKEGGIKAVPTGIEHGTITAVIDSVGYEITTLRSDEETDGRHAMVRFGRDWEIDASRRDLTMNALYCDRKGTLFDPLDGYDDVVTGTVRFIGDAHKRIEEDYLRILRFFRFYAWYGKGRPDPEGLKACARMKDNLDRLSVERVWKELKKTLGAPDPSRALLWMRTSGVLTKILPEGEQWGIDFLVDRINAEQQFSWPIDPMARLQVITAPLSEKTDAISKRLKFSGDEAERLRSWVEMPPPSPDLCEKELAKLLYRGEPTGMIDQLSMEIVKSLHRARVDGSKEPGLESLVRLLEFANSWQRPEFPVSGKDLQTLGIETGKAMGEELRRLEEIWVQSDFQMSQKDLLGLVQR